MEGELRWFEALYDAHADAIFRHLFLRLNDRERARELTQDVFTRAWQQVAAGKRIEHERAWLYRAAHNAFVNEIRTDKRAASLDEMIDESGYDIKDEHEEGRADAAASHAELLRYLAKLKDSYRAVLVMRYVDGLSVTEIAALTGENETNVSMRMRRALDKLRADYEGPPPTKE